MRFKIINMKLSAEPDRKSPYHADVCWRVIYQRIGMNLTYFEIASNLNIAVSTAYRIFRIFNLTGEVCRVTHQQRSATKKLNMQEELFVIGLVLNEPSMYLSEVCREMLVL